MPNDYSHDDLAKLTTSSGWRLETDGKTEHTGTLEHVATVAHQRRARGEHPGIIRRIETSIELEMLQLEQLWRNLGLPV
jgi:hypothetical protein